jgi:phage tail-like protein
MNNRYSWLVKLLCGCALVVGVLVCHPGSWEKQAAAQARAKEFDRMGVRIQVDVEGKFKGVFSGISGIGSKNEVIEMKTAGEKGPGLIRKVPGRMAWHDVVLTRGFTGEPSAWNWRQEVVEGKIEQARKKCIITVMDQSGRPTAIWELNNAWPSNLLIGPKEGGDVMIEEVTIAHEGAVRTGP